MRRLEMDLEVGQRFQISMGPIFKGRWYEIAGFENGRGRRVLVRRVGTTGRGLTASRRGVERWVRQTAIRQVEHAKQNNTECLKDALYWLTLIERGEAEPADARLFLDSIPDELLPAPQ